MLDNSRESKAKDNIGRKNQGGDRWRGSELDNIIKAEQELYRTRIDSRNIFTILSEIQRYYVIERRSDELPKEYFTIEQILGYFKSGFVNGMAESFIFLTLVPFLTIIYPSFKYYFLDSNITDGEILFFQIISYSPIIISTLFIIYIGKYYYGTITRRAIFSLINGRSLSFMVKGVLFYFLINWFIGYSLKNPNVLYELADITQAGINMFSELKISTEALYQYYYKYAVIALREASLSILLTMLFFAALPYGTIFLISYIKRVKKQKILEDLETY